MIRLLLASAATIAAISIPATSPAAQASAASGFTASSGFASASGVSVHRGGGHLSGFPSWSDDRRGHGRHDRRGHHDRGRDGLDVPFFYGGDWRYSDPNRSWEPHSYNDWWHERPARNTPRWVQDNGRCERMWWGGEGWRC